MNFPLWAGVSVAVAVAWAAWRAESLRADGASAAVVLGAAASAAGWAWAALLVAYFVTSAGLSRMGRIAKARRTAGTIAKGGARDWRQVMANGGVFGLAAATNAVWPDPRLSVVAAGALAASAADTWATEIGTWIGSTPRHVLTWQPLQVGMSGGVSAAGTVGLVVGGSWIAGIAWGLGVTSNIVAVAVGGAAGAVADSVLGATIQERRQCEACRTSTEQALHDCGTATRRVAGWPVVGNDAVNFLATLAGAIVAVRLSVRAG